MKMPNCGIILLRSAYSGPAKKISLMKKVLTIPESDLSGRFVVVTENAIRIAEKHSD
jgi:hypothetical protein